MDVPANENDIAVRHRKLLGFAGIALALCLYAYRFILLIDYCFKYLDNDTAIYWYATASYANGFFPEPFFFGQRYGLMIESILTVPLHWLKVPLWISVPLVSMLIYTLPFVIIALYTWKKDALASVLVLLIPCLSGLKYDVVTTFPRAFGSSYLITIIGALLLISQYKGKQIRTQILHGAGVFLMVLGMLANITALTVSALVICFVLVREFINGKSLKDNIRAHKYIGSLAGLLLGAVLFFVFDNFYIEHPDYIIYSSPKLSFSPDTLFKNLSEIKTISGTFSPAEELWFVFPALIVFISVYMLFIRRKLNRQMPFFLIMSFIGILMFMTMTKTRDFDADSYLYSQTRLYVFVPYLFAMLLCISTFYEKKVISSAKAKTVLIAAVSVIILLAVSAGVMKVAILKSLLKDGTSTLTNSDSYLEILPVEEVISEAERTKKACQENGIRYVVYCTPYRSTRAYGGGALNYGTVTTYNAFFERRTWIYNELKEVSSGPDKIYAVSFVNSGVITIPPEMSVVQYLETMGYTR